MALSMRTRRLNVPFDTINSLERRCLFPGVRQTDLLLRQRVAEAKDLYWRDLKGHFGCVNALEFSHGQGEFIASGGDDRRVLLWNVEKALSDIGNPEVMKGEHNSNIFCIAFNIDNQTAFSGGNDEQVLVHDLTTGMTKDVFLHEDAVYGLSVDPNNPHVFASACDDGRVLIYDVRESTADPFCLANYTTSMHAVVYNPVEPRLLATANAKEGVGLWDVRHPRSCVFRFGGSYVQQSCMSVKFNYLGDQLIALRRRLPPVLYKINSAQPVCEFDHSGYYNSCTMKSISYAGDRDQYVLSGSDEFNLYMWAVPEDLSERQYINSAHMVLKGHRSIVNQVRFNAANHLIISSGVEKIIKVWSPFQLQAKEDSTTKATFQERPVYTHEEYINISIQNGPVMSHDYTQESTEEDQRMMAFFDSLVQRELESVSSSDELSSNEEEIYSRIVQLSRSDLEMSDSGEEGNDFNTSEDDLTFSPFTIAFASVMASQSAEGNDRFPRLHAVPTSSEAGRIGSAVQPAGTSSGAGNASNSDRRPARRAISDLVKKRKREMKEGIQASLKKCARSTAQLSESDSSEDEPDKVPASDMGCLENKSSAQKQRMQLKLKRLQALRTMAMNSDSDLSDTEVKNSSVSATTIKAPASSESTAKGRASPDLGPYLHEMSMPFASGHCHGDGPSTSGISDKGKKKCSDSDDKLHSDVVESLECKDKGKPCSYTSTVSCNHETKKTSDSHSYDNHGTPVCGCNRDSECGDKLHNKFSKAGTSSACDSSENCSATSSQQTSDSQPTWTEFKRYKHKLERARRQYRRNRSSDKNQSDDEDES